MADDFYDFCACIGPQYNEKYCYCEMVRRGLPLNEKLRKEAEAKLEKKLSTVFAKYYHGQKPT